MKSKSLIIILLSTFIISCSTEEREIPTLEVGQDFTDNNVRIITIDTFEVRTSTFRFDSIVTSEGNRLLVGRYLDKYFGEIRSESYMELTATDYNLSEDAELDSIALILGYDHYFYNDTTQIFHLNIHKLLESFETDEDNFFNTSILKSDSVPIVSKRFFPEPQGEDSLHISLPVSFGQKIFESLKVKTITGDDDLTEQLKGIVLKPSPEDNSSIIGFSKNPKKTYLRFFYSLPQEFEDEGKDEVFDLIIKPGNSLNSYNHIAGDVAGSPLDTLVDQEINLSSFHSNHLSFMQSGVGFVTRIEFPTIRNIGDLPGTGTILNAVLEISPLRDSYDDSVPIRDSLQVQVVDQNNEFSSFLRNGHGLVFGRIIYENNEFNETLYQIPVASYIEEELREVPEIDNALIVFPKDFYDTLDRAVLEGLGSSHFEPKLILTYAIYDE